MKMLKKGFTLIELLVVIAIIGILATIVIINVSSARTKAVDTKAMSDLTAAGKIASICVTDGGDVTVASSAGAAVCTAVTGVDTSDAAGNWPALTGSGTYGTWVYTGTQTGQLHTSTTGFAVSAGNAATGATKTITCNYSGCNKTGF